MNPPLRASSAADAERYRLCWAERPADLFTPVRAFRALRAAGHHACLLESVEGAAGSNQSEGVGHGGEGVRGSGLRTQDSYAMICRATLIIDLVASIAVMLAS